MPIQFGQGGFGGGFNRPQPGQAGGQGGFQMPGMSNPVFGGGGNISFGKPKPKPKPKPPMATIPGGETGTATNTSAPVGGGGGVGPGKSVKDKFAQTAKGTKKRFKPAQEVFENYYKPAYEQAYKAAEDFGVDPSLYGQYAAASRNQAAQFNRMGMGQSGAAMAANQQLNRQFMDAEQQAGADANARRYDAFRGLAGDAYGQGSGAINSWQKAAGAFNQQAASRQQQRDQQKAAEAAGTAALIGGVADLGLALATGGASVPFQSMTGGIGGIMGGGADAYGRGSQFLGGTIDPTTQPWQQTQGVYDYMPESWVRWGARNNPNLNGGQ